MKLPLAGLFLQNYFTEQNWTNDKHFKHIQKHFKTLQLYSF
jgi:hypothetical protein